MENHLARPEVQSAILYGFGEDTRESHTHMENLHYAASKLANGDILRLSVPADTLFSFLMDMLLPMVFILLLLFSTGLRNSRPLSASSLRARRDGAGSSL